jgi:hypothetical protein
MDRSRGGFWSRTICNIWWTRNSSVSVQ